MLTRSLPPSHSRTPFTLTSFISNGGIPGGALTLGCRPYYLIGQINTGQADGTPGLDLNVAEAWQLGYTGKGVIIAIMDDGERINNPEYAGL